MKRALGLHAPVTDSLTPGGERALCRQRLKQRAVTQAYRRRDALRQGWQPVAPGVQRVADAGADHGVDGTEPLALRSDAPNGMHSGQGVLVGGNLSARATSRELLRLLGTR